MKFRYKLMLGFLITLCIAFCVGGMFIINHAFRYSLNEEIDKCLQNYASICNTIKIAGENSEGNYSQVVETVIFQINARKSDEYEYMQMVDLTNDILIFANSAEKLSKDFDFEKYGTTTSSYAWKQGDKYYYQIFGNITVNTAGEDNGIKLYNICVVYDITSVYLFRADEVSIYRKMILVFVGVGMVIAFMTAVWLTRPLEQLSKVVRKIAGGDIHYRSKIHSGDEVEALSVDINAMTDRIENDICELRESVKKQERFMGSFAHEMKTPMTSIIGYADLIRSHDMSREEIAESANYIFSEGKRLEALSLKMLELIVLNNEDIKMKVYNPSDIISDTVKMMRYTLKDRKILLNMNCEASGIMMDTDLFKSLMINLIDNAAKSIDENGVINIIGKVEKENYIIQIKDNGRGMSAEELKKITEAFYRVDKSRSRAQGGAGLGLAICKKIAELHHAELKYMSIPQVGTNVEITLKVWKYESEPLQ